MSTPIKFAYFGTPVFSTYVLDELAAAGLMPALIVTTPDKPAGRGLTPTASPVKGWALAHQIPLLQPETFGAKNVEELRNGNYDCFVVAAYGKILPAEVLALAARGGVNVHPSLLPRYRGTSPVESQILADEKRVGVSVIAMDEKMDHGPILAQEEITITDWPLSRGALNDLLWHAGGRLLAGVLPAWTLGTLEETPQDHAQATFTKKITKEMGEFDLAAPDRAHYLKYLAYEGWPGTYFFKDGKRMKITKASFKNGIFTIERVIPEGKPEQAYAGS